ncbi:MAG: multidrug efflux SMR transporter [Helicobacteraceae bacterium]|nr:multidrug efflux SMR transporter [Helicobacteraceae bacterium]
MRKPTLSTNLAWVLVLCGGIVECFWVSGLKYANSPFFYALTALGISFSFIAMIIACKKIEVSVAYAVFVGIGTAGVVISEIVVFNEPFSLVKISLIALLLASVIGLKLTSKEKEELIVVAEVTQDLGIDKILELDKN